MDAARTRRRSLGSGARSSTARQRHANAVSALASHCGLSRMSCARTLDALRSGRATEELIGCAAAARRYDRTTKSAEHLYKKHSTQAKPTEIPEGTEASETDNVLDSLSISAINWRERSLNNHQVLGKRRQQSIPLELMEHAQASTMHCLPEPIPQKGATKVQPSLE